MLALGVTLHPGFTHHIVYGLCPTYDSSARIPQEVFRLLQEVIEPFHGQTFPLQQAAEAVRIAQQPEQKAKTLLSS